MKEYICVNRFECGKSRGCSLTMPTQLNDNQIAENFECELMPDLGELKIVPTVGDGMADKKINDIHKSIVRLESEISEKENHLSSLKTQLNDTKNYYRGLFEMYELKGGGK